jgi:hypothetical protein
LTSHEKIELGAVEMVAKSAVVLLTVGRKDEW